MLSGSVGSILESSSSSVKWGQQEWKQELLNWVEAGGSSGGVVVCAGAGSERERESPRGSEDLPAPPQLRLLSARAVAACLPCPRGHLRPPKGLVLQSCAPTRVVSQRDSKEHIHFLSFGQTSFARCEGRVEGGWRGAL